MTDFVNARPWRDDEYAFLEDHPELTNREAGLALRRTEQAVMRKRQKLRKGWEPTLDPWDPEDVSFIRENPHMTAKQQADSLGFSLSRVLGQRNRLRMKEGVTFASNGTSKLPTDIGGRTLLAKTCPSCGYFLPARWFQFVKGKGGYWSTKCSRCASGIRRQYPEGNETSRARSYASRQRQQEVSLVTAIRNRDEWTGSDHTILADPELSTLEKAVRLGRSYYAVQHVTQEHGYKNRTGLGSQRTAWSIRFESAE